MIVKTLGFLSLVAIATVMSVGIVVEIAEMARKFGRA
jgi:hypothetical protein